MKAREWQRFMDSQRRLHGKTIFTVTELANVSGSSAHALNVELSRLQSQGILMRHARGRYGLPEPVDAADLLPHLDSGAYLTGAYALFRHNLIDQVPRNICCFTNRRHNRSRVRTTAVGQVTFVCVRPPIYAPPATALLAPPEQALCDLVFTMRHKGLDSQAQFTFRGLARLDGAALRRIAARYPATTRRSVERLVTSV